MSKKYSLVPDKDGKWMSVKQHIGALLWVILVPLVVLFALAFINGFANFDTISQNQNEQARFEATWEAGKAIPTRTPTP